MDFGISFRRGYITAVNGGSLNISKDDNHPEAFTQGFLVGCTHRTYNDIMTSLEKVYNEPENRIRRYQAANNN